MMVIKCCSAYCQDFAIPFFIKELLPLFKIYTFELLCATPHLLCTTPHTVLMWFELNFHCGNGRGGSVRPSPSVCPSVTHVLLCATPPTVLMRFEPNFHRIALSPSIVSILRFHYLSRNYCLLFKFTLIRLSVRHTFLCATPPTVLMRFEPNFHRMIVTKCRSAYCQYFAIPLFNKELLPFV